MINLSKVVEKFNSLMKRVGGTALTGMMLVTCVDVIFRYFDRPIFGAVEVVSFLATLVLACAMPSTHFEKGHVGVDLIVRRLKPAHQALVDTFTSGISTVLFGLVSWQMFLYAQEIRRTGEVSMSLQFPTYFIVFLVALAFLGLTAVIFVGFLNHLKKAISK